MVINDTSEYFYSKKGVTQGDPLSMFIYALATIPLLGHPTEGTHIWYVDDASACSKLQYLKEWFDHLLQVGPSYGYHPEPSKCILVVHSDHLLSAHYLFNSYGVKVLTSSTLLGGVIGDHDGFVSYVSDCVNGWMSVVKNLVLIAESQPQLAYSAFTRSVQSQWTYLQRVVPNCGSFFNPLEQLISQQFIPTIFGCEISPTERSLFTLPARMGGLNILDPTSFDNTNYLKEKSKEIFQKKAVTQSSEENIEDNDCEPPSKKKKQKTALSFLMGDQEVDDDCNGEVDR